MEEMKRNAAAMVRGLHDDATTTYLQLARWQQRRITAGHLINAVTETNVH